MGISAEAIIGLVALFVTCPPLPFSYIAGPLGGKEVIKKKAARLNAAWFRDEGSFRSIPEYAIAGINPQDRRNHSLELRSHVFLHRVSTSCLNKSSYNQPSQIMKTIQWVRMPHGADAPPWIADCNQDANKTASLAAQVQQDVCVKETRNITADAVGISGTSGLRRDPEKSSTGKHNVPGCQRQPHALVGVDMWKQLSAATERLWQSACLYV